MRNASQHLRVSWFRSVHHRDERRFGDPSRAQRGTKCSNRLMGGAGTSNDGLGAEPGKARRDDHRPFFLGVFEKRLELPKQVRPQATTFGYLLNAANPAQVQARDQSEDRQRTRYIDPSGASRPRRRGDRMKRRVLIVLAAASGQQCRPEQ